MQNNYNVKLTKKAEKYIKKQDKDTQKRLIKAIVELPEGDIKKLKGMDELYRLRVGDFRVIFEKKDTELIIIVVDIGNRGQIYK
ncbi:type II toxin-antitoxin system RelE/ParE family toxin [Clostridiaceae bacterium UIB06]|nr:type II toxin-antitoxin system RelE/ParE family toxin [Clostridiaceae bacterium UIB06]